MQLQTRTRATLLAVVVATLALAAGEAAALPEADNQLCYKFKDVNAVAGDDVVAQFSTATCRVKVKAAYWCAPFDRGGDDDPRGGVLGQSVCYKLKCDDTGGTITNLILDTFIGTHGAQQIDFDKPKLVCVPVGFD